jgi:hypothetical protein
MNRSHLVCGLAMILAVGTAPAATTTFVSLAGRDDALPKLGLPRIAVTVHAPRDEDTRALGDELTRELAKQVHTRARVQDEAGDYDLIVWVSESRVDTSSTVVPFEAFLYTAASERLWRIEGRSEVADAPVDASVFVGIGRNVVAALVHDGWIAPRLDPDDPPPQPPSVRLENGR